MTEKFESKEEYLTYLELKKFQLEGHLIDATRGEEPGYFGHPASLIGPSLMKRLVDALKEGAAGRELAFDTVKALKKEVAKFPKCLWFIRLEDILGGRWPFRNMKDKKCFWDSIRDDEKFESKEEYINPLAELDHRIYEIEEDLSLEALDMWAKIKAIVRAAYDKGNENDD